MSKEKHYSSEKNIQIVLALLKANGIRKIVISPGATNYSFVGSVQHDSYFQLYSSVDERSAAYMACGMAAECGEPIVLSCTGSTASRNYYPGLTEAFYRKLPVLAVTSHQGPDRIGQLIPQNIDRRQLAHDIAKISVELPIIKDEADWATSVLEANKAILELRRNGGGPGHINLVTTFSRDFSVKVLPKVRVMRRYQAWDALPDMQEGKICVYVGSNIRLTEQQEKALDCFCATHDAIVFCESADGYNGNYTVPLFSQEKAKRHIDQFDLMIHIGEAGRTTITDYPSSKEVWRVSEDGELCDPFGKLTNVFQMSEESFFLHYGKDSMDKHERIDQLKLTYEKTLNDVVELPFGKEWIAQQLSSRLAESSEKAGHLHVPIIQGGGELMYIIGASYVNPTRLYYGITDDKATLYNLFALDETQVGNNIRMIMVNNSSMGIRHIAEDSGYAYLKASNKDDFMEALEAFTSPGANGKSVILECFIDRK